jgi:translation initiation factor IF-3
VNERIRAREVRLIDENGAQLGVMPIQQALQLARQRDLDLIEVAPNAQPPVCRIMDFGKHKYQMQKKESEARKKAHTSEMHLIRLKPQIDKHDLGIKVRKLREMLGEGDKVRIQLRFRGREMSRPHLGMELLNNVAEQVTDIATVESYPRLEGRMMNMLLSPRPGLKAAASAAPKAAKPAAAAKPAEGEAKAPAAVAQAPAPTTAPAPAPAPAPVASSQPAPAPAPVAEAPPPEPKKEELEDYGIGKQAEDTEDGGEAG